MGMAEGLRAISKREMGLLACISIVPVGPLSSFAQSGLSPILPRIAEHFSDVPNAEVLVRLMISGLSFAMILGSLMAGFVAERLGPKRLLLILLCIFAVAGSAGYLLDNLYMLLVLRLVVGAAIAASAVMTATIITTRLSSVERERWLGFYIVIATLGGVAALALVGWVAKADWRNAFLIHLLAVPVLLFILFALPSDKSFALPTSSAGGGDGGRVPWALILFGIACGITLTTCIAFLPFHLKLIGVTATEKMALPMSIGALTGGLSAMGFGYVRSRLSVIGTFMLGFALVGLGIGIAVATASYMLVNIGMFIFGLGVGCVSPNLFSAAAAASPLRYRARAMGFVRAGFYSGPLVGQLALEPVSKMFGASVALMMVALFSLAMIVLSRLATRAFTPVDEPELAPA